jgi:hypothetical protein
LVFFNPKYALPIVLGTFISNTTSSLGWYDMVFGTFATLLSVLVITKCKNVYQAALAPIVFNGVIVALELFIALKIDFMLSLIFVSFGEAVVLFLIGIPVMNSIMNNQVLLETLGLEHKEIKGFNKVSLINSVVIGLTTVLIIFFFACPIMYKPFSAIYNDSVTLFNLCDSNKLLYFSLILPILYLVLFVVLKGNIKKMLTLIISITLFILTIYAPIKYELYDVNVYYFIYMIVVISLITLPFINEKITKEKLC